MNKILVVCKNYPIIREIHMQLQYLNREISMTYYTSCRKYNHSLQRQSNNFTD